MTRVELPYPIPLHALWLKHRGGGGIPTPRYKAYGKEAWARIAQQKPRKLKGRVSVFIRLVAPDKRGRDGDNLLKCLFDTLKTNGLIEDDSNRIVVRHSLEWAADGPPCVVLIQTAEVEMAA
jgi:crossover junction endodeoxyribonuclease RusA